MKKNLLLPAVVILLTLSAGRGSKDKPENLVLFIGDGMGVAHVFAGMMHSDFKMEFPAFPVTGFSITFSLNSKTTDSAAGGTAIATGEKTNNRMISMRPDSTEIKTLFELAKEKGMSTGIVCTSSLTDATPATFVTHVMVRNDYYRIAKGYLSCNADVFIGGGLNHFNKRPDSLDLTMELKKAGYDVVYTLEDFKKSGAKRVAGLMSGGDMPLISAGRDPEYLAEATAKAIEILSANPKGYVLMVEGSEVDDGGHNKDLNQIVDEVTDMDRAVTVARRYADRRNNTLIVVTADHETGGMSLIDGETDGREINAAFSTGSHTAVMVPVFAYGPGAEAFSGVQENTDLFRDFVRLLSLEKK